jgi:hypothetical protein
VNIAVPSDYPHLDNEFHDMTEWQVYIMKGYETMLELYSKGIHSLRDLEGRKKPGDWRSSFWLEIKELFKNS